MNTKLHYIFMIVGIVTIAYIAVRYLIPMLIHVIGMIFSVMAYIAAFALSIAVLLLAVGFIIRYYRKSKYTN